MIEVHKNTSCQLVSFVADNIRDFVFNEDEETAELQIKGMSQTVTFEKLYATYMSHKSTFTTFMCMFITVDNDKQVDLDCAGTVLTTANKCTALPSTFKVFCLACIIMFLENVTELSCEMIVSIQQCLATCKKKFAPMKSLEIILVHGIDVLINTRMFLNNIPTAEMSKVLPYYVLKSWLPHNLSCAILSSPRCVNATKNAVLRKRNAQYSDDVHKFIFSFGKSPCSLFFE